MQPETDRDDRDCIIVAAYDCLAEPHDGPIPVAAILQRAGMSTRAFYRHFESKDELFLAMVRQETDELAGRLERITAQADGPVAALKGWIDGMFALIADDRTRMRFTIIDSDEVRAAKGYRETREQAHAVRERSLIEVLENGRADGTFPLADPGQDAIAISSVISRVMFSQRYDAPECMHNAQHRVLDFALRALGARAAMSSG